MMDYIQHYKKDLALFDYAQDLTPSQKEDERRRFETLAALGRFRKGEMVLDVGPGAGWLSSLLSRQGAKVCGLDVSAEQWGRSREEKGQFVVGDALDLPFKDNCLHGVVLSEVLEHLKDPNRAVKEGFRTLRFGGRLLASVPHKERIRYTLCIHCNQPTPINAHLHQFSTSKLSEILGQAQFELRRMVKFMPGTLPLLGLNRFLSFLPFPLWRIVERLLPGNPKFLICLGEKVR